MTRPGIGWHLRGLINHALMYARSQKFSKELGRVIASLEEALRSANRVE